MKHILFALPLLVGCGGGSGDGGASCSLTDRVGMYWVEWRELSGDCGPVAAGLSRIDDELPEGCERLEADSVSDDQCQLERTMECVTEQGIMRGVGVTRQLNDDASRVDGTISMTLYTHDGVEVCSGSYDLIYERR